MYITSVHTTKDHRMRTLTDEEKIEIDNKNTYLADKETLLNKYKSYASDLEYASDDVEEGLAKSKRANLAVKIKALSRKLEAIEELETLV